MHGPDRAQAIAKNPFVEEYNTKYGRTGLFLLVEAAADAYTRHEFIGIFNDIRSRSPKLAASLEESDFAKYNTMTTNIAESLNSILNLACELPIMSLYETIRLTLTTWFHERREKALKHKKLITPRVVKMILERSNAAMKLDAFQVDWFEFEVKDETRKYIVHLENKQCTCLIFNIGRIPCVHAIVAAKRTNKDENKYVDQVYLTETWAKAYAESIHPC
ncbi:uncharacterized protein LOC112088899 [Eutrema salsugineum]|uniref:uncharacterized protein LOC112088899 n=1 Tax=Eutrema salsugineum TaxID=72664 RepID=UPI000CED7830|nr:uncharacterized protein LOC112088899 [Eutrema salsugineum]